MEVGKYRGYEIIKVIGSGRYKVDGISGRYDSIDEAKKAIDKVANKRISYWTVEKGTWGFGGPMQYFFREYKNAKAFYNENNYVSDPVKHTANPRRFAELEFNRVFED